MNILKYNAGSNKDILYGVESPLYYVKNLVLNLGICVLFAAIGIVFKFMQLWTKEISSFDVKMLGIYVSALTWLGILFSRAHKVMDFLRF